MVNENTQKLIGAFSAALEINSSLINDDLKYQSIPEWDSITHMFLINEIENVFELEIDPDDVIDFYSFANAKEILLKYHVAF